MSKRGWALSFLALAVFNIRVNLSPESALDWSGFFIGLACLFLAGMNWADWSARR